MPKTVWKFEIQLDDEFRLEMPAGAEIVHIAVQHQRPCLWASVDPQAPTESRTFVMRGTGHSLPEQELVHRGSFLLYGSEVGFHVFEIARS